MKEDTKKQEETHARELTRVRDELKMAKRDHASLKEKETEIHSLKEQIASIKEASAQYKEAGDRATNAQARLESDVQRLTTERDEAGKREAQARQDAGTLRLELNDVKAQCAALESNLTSAVSGGMWDWSLQEVPFHGQHFSLFSIYSMHDYPWKKILLSHSANAITDVATGLSAVCHVEIILRYPFLRTSREELCVKGHYVVESHCPMSRLAESVNVLNQTASLNCGT